MNKIVTSDETLCYLFDIQPKRASSKWKSPSSLRSKKNSAREQQREIQNSGIFLFSRNCDSGFIPMSTTDHDTLPKYFTPFEEDHLS